MADSIFTNGFINNLELLSSYRVEVKQFRSTAVSAAWNPSDRNKPIPTHTLSYPINLLGQSFGYITLSKDTDNSQIHNLMLFNDCIYATDPIDHQYNGTLYRVGVRGVRFINNNLECYYNGYYNDNFNVFTTISFLYFIMIIIYIPR